MPDRANALEPTLAARLVHPLIAGADAALREHARRLEVLASASARAGLVRALEHRVVEVCAPVLALERRAATLLGLEASIDERLGEPEAWQRRCANYPGLPALLDRIEGGWHEHVVEFLSRWRSDSNVLAGGALARVPSLERVEAAGDPHSGGRSVLLFELSDGRSFVYKPKDLRIAAWVQRLFHALNAAGHEPSFPTYGVWAMDGYGWEQRVTPEPCADAASVERFYRRLGALLRVFQCLGARDLWMDNLVARADEPIFIDLEMAMQPLGVEPANGGSAEMHARSFLEESVAPLSMLSMIVPIAAGTPAEDLGVLARAGCFRLPYPSDPDLDVLLGRPAGSDGFRRWSCSAHAPTLRGNEVSAADYAAAIEEGYRATHDFSSRHRELLSAELDALGPADVRYVPRSTWLNWRLIRAGLSPAALSDTSVRERLFESVLEDPTKPVNQSLARCEVEAWKRAEIPYFTAPVNELVVRAAGGGVVLGALAESAMTRARRHVRELPSFDLERHAGLVRTLVRPRPTRRADPAATGQPALRTGLAEALRYGDVLLEMAFEAGGERCWVGRAFEPRHGVAPVKVLAADLPTGTGGLAVLFAELHVASGHDRFRRAALACAGQISLQHEDAAGDVGWFGLGGRFYSLCRSALLLDDAENRARALAWAQAVDIDRLTEHAPLDLIAGTHGLFFALLGAAPLVGPGLATRALRAIAARAPSGTDDRWRYVDHDGRLASLPDVVTVQRIAVSRAERQLGGTLPLIALHDAPPQSQHAWSAAEYAESADPFEPSVIWGLGACARSALRRDYPSLVPSLVLMD